MISPLPQVQGLTVSFNTTENCNLRCKYCYEIEKTPKTLSLDHAQKFIDLLLSDPDPVGLIGTDFEELNSQSLIMEFIGGDALSDPDLIRQIVRYLIWKANLLGHHWANDWVLSICTNGTYFGNSAVRKFLEEFQGHISLTVSIDGVPFIQDLNRIFPDGAGSSRVIEALWPWYVQYCKEGRRQPTIKSTLAKNSIPYISTSVKYFHETLGLSYVAMNFIMEDMKLEETDLEILDKELKDLSSYLYSHRKDLYLSLFNRVPDHDCSGKRCGTGMMPALGVDGYIYPCFRWLPHSVTSVESSRQFCLGHVDDTVLHKDRFRVVRNHTDLEISDEECTSCSIQHNCPFCLAGCYSEFSEFRRTKYICRVSKLVNKWVKHYWEKIDACHLCD